ncbi:hypothetical protein [Aquimarina sp. ERC-38]
MPVSKLQIDRGVFIVKLENSQWNYTEKIIVQ